MIIELVVQLPGVDDPTRVKDIMQSTALLELKLVQDGPYSSREAALAAHGGVLPPDTELLPGSTGQNGNEIWYVLNRIAAVTGRDLSGAEPSHDQAGRPSVNFTLNRDGAERFGRVTGANINKLLAIVLDNRVYSAPEIHGQITDRGEITGGNFTPQTARTWRWCCGPAPCRPRSNIFPRRPSVRRWEPIRSAMGWLPRLWAYSQ